MIRLVTALLLAWIAVDLAAIHTCALDVDTSSGRAHTSAAAVDGPGTAAHQHAVLHPDHCFCHGVSVGPGTAVRLSTPLTTTGRLAELTPGHCHWTTTVLDHPPKTLA
jgi:hypothetical protein